MLLDVHWGKRSKNVRYLQMVITTNDDDAAVTEKHMKSHDMLLSGIS